MPGYTSPLNIPYPTSTDRLDDAVSTIPQLQAEKVNDLIAALSAVAAVAPTDLTPGSGWAHVSGTVRLWYARGAGLVTVHLGVSKASWSGGDTVGTLPAGFRPTRPVYWTANWGAGQVRSGLVTTGGGIQADAGTGGLLGSFNFPV